MRHKNQDLSVFDCNSCALSSTAGSHHVLKYFKCPKEIDLLEKTYPNFSVDNYQNILLKHCLSVLVF